MRCASYTHTYTYAHRGVASRENSSLLFERIFKSMLTRQKIGSSKDNKIDNRIFLLAKCLFGKYLFGVHWNLRKFTIYSTRDHFATNVSSRAFNHRSRAENKNSSLFSFFLVTFFLVKKTGKKGSSRKKRGLSHVDSLSWERKGGGEGRRERRSRSKKRVSQAEYHITGARLSVSSIGSWRGQSEMRRFTSAFN